MENLWHEKLFRSKVPSWKLFVKICEKKEKGCFLFSVRCMMKKVKRAGTFTHSSINPSIDQNQEPHKGFFFPEEKIISNSLNFEGHQGIKKDPFVNSFSFDASDFNNAMKMDAD